MAPTPAPGSMVLLTRLARVVYRRAKESVLGMSLKEYMALSSLRDHKNVSQQVLGDALHLDPNNCVLLLNGLESSGLIERRRGVTSSSSRQPAGSRSSVPSAPWRASKMKSSVR